jgi:hypothetical protein
MGIQSNKIEKVQVAIHEKVVYTLREMTDYFPISTFDQMLVLKNAITANPLFAKQFFF